MIELFHYMHLRVNGWDLLRLIAAGIASALTYALGDTDNWLLGLIVLMIADYISGVTAAYIRNELSSKRGLAGVLKNAGAFSRKKEKNYFRMRGTWDTEEDCLDLRLYELDVAGGYAHGMALGTEYLTTMHDEGNVVEFDDLHTCFFTDVGTV